MNIVHLQDYDSSRRPMPRAQAEEVIQACRAQAEQQLASSLKTMMNGVDDALFELAEKAENNSIQSLYFDAMREVRIKREGMEGSFMTALRSGIEQAMQGGVQEEEYDYEHQGELSLIGDDDLEETIAVTTMVDKVKISAKEELALLEQRWGYLLNDPELRNHQFAFNPKIICQAFLVACEAIESGLKVKLIILKLFDRFVATEQLPMLYRALNKTLVKQNVLPDLKLNARIKRHPAQARKGGGAQAAIPPESDQDESWSQLQQLLGGGAGAGFGGDGGAGAGGGYGGAAGSISRIPGFMSGLTSAQQGDVELAGGGLSMLSGAAIASGSVNVIRDIKAQAVAAGVSGVDAMLIDVVEMLFDYILSDSNIPDQMKAVIGRLQIPVLKVAILDRDFFSRKSHPARLFLNRMAEAAAGWTEEAGKGLYEICNRLVQQVLVKFEQDVSLFDEVLAELEDFLNKELEQVDQQESQCTRVAQGKERLQLAKESARLEIERRTRTTELPTFVNQFLTQYWQNLLLVKYMMEGEGSIGWKQSLATMDNLVWSVRPKSARERDRLVKLLPPLLSSLREGASAIAMREEAFKQFLSQLADVHAEIVNHAVQETGDLVAETPDFEDMPALEEDDEVAVATLSRLIDENELEGVNVEEIILSEDAPEEADADDEFVEQARALVVGNWLELENEAGNKVRAKLTWVSSVTGNYLFTDRNGHKAAELTLPGLATALRRNTARVIEDVPLFDRAVSSLIDGLKGQTA